MSGTALNIDPWLVLGHELCGHAWLGNAGKHGPDEAAARGEGGHQETVARENEALSIVQPYSALGGGWQE